MLDPCLNSYQVKDETFEIITFPHPTLVKKAKPVTEFNAELEKICHQMLHTMYHAPGIGLAAPQVNLSIRLLVLDIQYEREEIEDVKDSKKNKDSKSHLINFKNIGPQIFINPEILGKSGRTKYQEGCLSLPGIYEDVERDAEINLRYQDTTGKFHEIKCDGLLSICLQHEMDHLEGIVFVDRISDLKRNFYKNKLTKEKQKKGKSKQI